VPIRNRVLRTTPLPIAVAIRHFGRALEWWRCGAKNSIANGHACVLIFFGAAENLAPRRPWGDMVTSASVSVRASHDYLRRAGAQRDRWLNRRSRCPLERRGA